MAGGPVASTCVSEDPEMLVTLSVPDWTGVTAYLVGDKIISTISSGAVDLYRCTTAGTTNASEPIWDTTIGNTTNDGTVVWTRVTNTITWVGEAWDISTDSGLQKTVCPTTYFTHNTSPLSFGHFWRKSSYELRFSRGAIGTYGRHFIVVSDGDNGGFVASDWRSIYGLNNSTIGIMNTSSPFAASSDYLIPAAWLTGSVTGFGITYAWSKGNGWP